MRAFISYCELGSLGRKNSDVGIVYLSQGAVEFRSCSRGMVERIVAFHGLGCVVMVYPIGGIGVRLATPRRLTGRISRSGMWIFISGQFSGVCLDLRSHPCWRGLLSCLCLWDAYPDVAVIICIT